VKSVYSQVFFENQALHRQFYTFTLLRKPSSGTAAGMLFYGDTIHCRVRFLYYSRIKRRFTPGFVLKTVTREKSIRTCRRQEVTGKVGFDYILLTPHPQQFKITGLRIR